MGSRGRRRSRQAYPQPEWGPRGAATLILNLNGDQEAQPAAPILNLVEGQAARHAYPQPEWGPERRSRHAYPQPERGPGGAAATLILNLNGGQATVSKKRPVASC